jgi:VWFA-related protein
MIPRRSIVGLALLVWAVSLHSQTAASSPGTATTIKTSVRLVLVDVVVNDDKGAAVPGLHKEDFEILEEGKPQTIANFQEHVGAPLTQIKLPPMPPHVFTNFPLVQSADSVIVLLLDALNTPSKDQSYVHSQMIRYLRTTPPGTRMAIFTLASQLRMLQGMTTDSKELLAALNNAKANPQSSPLRASAVESDANQGLIDFMSENSMAAPAKTLAQASVDPINAMKEFLADTAAYQTEARTHITLEAFQQLGRYLSALPGRKNVIWVSGSFPTGIFPDAELADPFKVGTTFQEEIRKTDALLAASQVALYPIAAEGLASDAVFEANNKEIGEKRPSLAVRDQVRQMQSDETDRDLSHQAMEIIARDTGGRAYYNTNGLKGALDRVIENGTHYYSLAYSPANTTTDGRYRRIQVKLLNRKESLAYRRGYYASELGSALAQERKTDSDPLLPLMGRNMPDYTQVLYKLLVRPSDPQPAADAPRAGSNLDLKGPFTRYSVDFAIAARDLKLEAQADNTHHATVEVRLVAYDREGKPVNLVETKGDVLLRPEEFAAVQKSGLPIHQEIDLPKEYVYLRTGVYDLRSNAAGTLGVPLPIEVSAAAK